MPNKTKADIRHNKLTAKAEKAVKEDKMNKNERLVKKANKLNERAGLGKENIAFGMKPPYSMEDLSGDGKVTQKDVLIGKGVLNKDGSKAKPANEMKGYQMNYKMVNRQGFEMAGNPSMKFDPTKDPNLSLMNDPNLSGLDLPSTGDNVNFEGENMNVANVDVNKTFRTKLFSDLDPNIVDAAKKYNLEKYGTLNPTAAGKTNNQTLDSFNAVVNLASIPQPGTPEVKGDAFTSFDKRQEIRQGKNVTGQSIRNKNKIRRAEKRIDKLQTKARANADITDPKFLKKQKRFQNKIAKTNIRKEGLQERQGFLDTSKSNYKKQIEQGINPDVGKKGRVTLQAGTPGSSKTSALPNVKEIFQSDKVKILKNKLAAGAGNGMKPMNLPGNALKYFKKKNNK